MGKIFDEIGKFVKNNYIFFTTPGHKQGRAYKNFKNILKYDLTEIKGLDNLHKPESCIKDSLEELSEFYDSKKSYYLLNGSTSGIQIMIFSFFNEYDEVLIERGCHKSVIDAIFLRKLKVNYINREKYNVNFLLPKEFLKINYKNENLILDDIKCSIEKNPKIKGVILTNPNYYGFYIEHQKIYDYLKSKDVFLLIDSAHGSHIKSFNKKLNCTNKFCDACVMSAHKTLSTFTQGSYLHINNKRVLSNVDEYFSIFTTTSPSYLTMISLEKGLEDCKKYFKINDILVERCDNFRKEVKKIEYLNTIDNSYVYNKSNGNFYYDDSRICIKFDIENINPNYLYDYLFSKKIVCEMTFFNGVILIPTIYTKISELNYLKDELIRFKYKIDKNYIFEIILRACFTNYEKKMDPYELQNRKYKFVKIHESEGEVLFNDIFLYPPGVPIVFRGEKILKEHIDLINEYRKLCYDVNGLFKYEYLKVLED